MKQTLSSYVRSLWVLTALHLVLLIVPLSSAANNGKRVVIFVGPHKSATSTVQEFLVQYATGRPKYRKLKAFRDWRWPLIASSKVPARKQWAQLVLQPNDTDFLQQIQAALLEKYNDQNVANLAFGSEEMDRFGPTPWSHRNGIQAVERIQHWLPKEAQIELVVNYRTPRRDQWISIWKQLMAKDEMNIENEERQQEEETATVTVTRSYPDWICHDEIRVWEYWNSVANPFGLADAFLDRGFSVTLLDMGGVAAKGLDIAHVSACDILRVPCTRGWVRGVNRTLVVNTKSRPLDHVSTQQLSEVEWLLRQRDCAYQAQLSSHSNFTMLYADDDSLWKDCDKYETTTTISNPKNTTWAVQLLQSQFGCQSDPSLNLTNVIMTMRTENGNQGDSYYKNNKNPTIPSSTDGGGIDWIIVLLLQGIIVVILFGSLFRKSPCRRPQTKQGKA